MTTAASDFSDDGSDGDGLDRLATASVGDETTSTNAKPKHRNPTGRNQYENCPPKDCPRFLDLLKQYHKTTTNCKQVSKMLAEEYGMAVSGRTIRRRWNDMGLKGSKLTEEELPYDAMVKLVKDQMDQNPGKNFGQNPMKRRIALNTGVHLRRKTIAKIQKSLDPEGFAARNPYTRHFRQLALASKGPNEFWFSSGLDTLCRCGFTIWGLRDKYSQRWLGLWVVPNYRIVSVIAYLWLTVVKDIGGIPLQPLINNDTGGNTLVYELTKALREAVSSCTAEKHAHVFLRSIQHMPIERNWLNFKQDLGETFPNFLKEGANVFQEDNQTYRYLAAWLWPPLIQKELDKFCKEANNQQKGKILPSPNIAFEHPERFEGINCLETIDMKIVEEMLEGMQTEKDALTEWGVPDEFARRAQETFDRLGVQEIKMSNVWLIFCAMINFV